MYNIAQKITVISYSLFDSNTLEVHDTLKIYVITNSLITYFFVSVI